MAQLRRLFTVEGSRGLKPPVSSNDLAMWVEQHWIGSDIGRMSFMIGMLVLLIGGVVTAVGLDCATPLWLRAFFAALGPGVLAGNLFGLGPAFLCVPALGAYGAAFMAYGRYLRCTGLPSAPADGSPA